MMKFRNYINQIVCAWPGVLLLFLLQFLWWCKSPTDSVPFWVVHIVAIICLFMVVVVYAVLKVYYESKTFEVPIPVRCTVPSKSSPDSVVVVVSCNEILHHDMMVSIIFTDPSTKVKEFVSLGCVENNFVDGLGQKTLQIVAWGSKSMPASDLLECSPSDLFVLPYVNSCNIYS